jgi:hypothetical protein
MASLSASLTNSQADELVPIELARLKTALKPSHCADRILHSVDRCGGSSTDSDSHVSRVRKAFPTAMMMNFSMGKLESFLVDPTLF